MLAGEANPDAKYLLLQKETFEKRKKKKQQNPTAFMPTSTVRPYNSTLVIKLYL